MNIGAGLKSKLEQMTKWDVFKKRCRFILYKGSKVWNSEKKRRTRSSAVAMIADRTIGRFMNAPKLSLLKRDH